MKAWLVEPLEPFVYLIMEMCSDKNWTLLSYASKEDVVVWSHLRAL